MVLKNRRVSVGSAETGEMAKDKMINPHTSTHMLTHST